MNTNWSFPDYDDIFVVGVGAAVHVMTASDTKGIVE